MSCYLANHVSCMSAFFVGAYLCNICKGPFLSLLSAHGRGLIHLVLLGAWYSAAFAHLIQFVWF